MTTIGLIGAGHIGSQVARLAVRNGHRVVISNSRDPETLSGLVAELGPNARAATALEAEQAGDIVVVTVPLKNYREVPVEPLAGKTVIDTKNYYPQRDGHCHPIARSVRLRHSRRWPAEGGWRIQRDTPGYGPRAARRRNCAETSPRPNGTRICERKTPQRNSESEPYIAACPLCVVKNEAYLESAS